MKQYTSPGLLWFVSVIICNANWYYCLICAPESEKCLDQTSPTC